MAGHRRGCKRLTWDANHPSEGQTAQASTEYAYDELDRLTTVTQPFGGPGGGDVVTSYDYDVQDHLTKVIDGEGNVTDYVYSDRDLLTQETSEVSGDTFFAYNEHGELESQTDARGITMVRTVDELDRVTFVDYPTDSLDVTYVYDDPLVPFSLGRLTAIVRDGESVDYEYDRFGRATRDGDLTYDYDDNGNHVEIGYPGDVRAVYTYDYADRPSTLDVEGLGGTLMQPIVTAASYLPSGPLDSLTLGNGLTETRPYDQRYYPDRITIIGGSTLLDWDYATDDVGNVLTITDVLDAANNRTYGYQDHQYFLTQGDGPWGELDWTYDKIGNRLSESRDGQPADVYNYLTNGTGRNLPQLDNIALGAGGMREYSYDAAGNQTHVAEGTDVLDYTYDDASRLTRMERPTASASTDLRYDGRSFLKSSLGRKQETGGASVFCDGFESGDTSTWMSGLGECQEVGVTQPIYSSEGVLHFLNRRVNVGVAPADRYSLYIGQRPVASLDLLSGSVTVQYLSVDHLGTPCLVSDTFGASVWSGGFEPYGADYADAQSTELPLRLPGQLHDDTWSSTGLTAGFYYNVNRWYSPAEANYTWPDPFLQLATSFAARVILLPDSRYSYALQRPTVLIDPLGLLTDDPVGCVTRWTAVGAGIGSAIGAATGGAAGATGGGAGCTFVAPGVGTIGCGIAGGSAGSSSGAATGGAIGAAIGALVGKLVCECEVSFPQEIAMESDVEGVDCRKVKEQCIRKCSDETLPTRTLDGAPFFKCLRECLDSFGC